MALGAPTEAIPAARALLSIQAWGLACVKDARWVGGGLGFSWFGRSSLGHGCAGPGTNRRRPMTRGGVRPEAIVAVIKLAFEAAGWVTGRATGIAGPVPLRRVHHAAD